ncbi:DMT family transporter [Paenibacillus arenosi]|nr:DMT family transporter [Paenibacillus arenosi]
MKNGIYLAILASLVFSIMNALVKAVSFTIPSTEVAFFRSLIGTILIFTLMRKSNVSFSTTGIPMLITRGVLGALYLITYFYAISKISLTDATILAHMSPIFVFILAFFFLKEKLSRQMIYIMPIAFVGALLLVKPFQFSSYSMYALIGLLSAVLGAGAATSIRYLSQRHHAYEIVFYFLATATLVSIPLMWNSFVMPNTTEWIYLVAIGVVSLVGQVFLTKAFTHENAIVVEVTRYIGIVFNVLWGFLFWFEIPDIYTTIGGCLIVATCIMMSRSKQKWTNQQLIAERTHSSPAASRK